MPEITVVYQDEAILILDKPSGLVTHGEPGRDSVVEQLMDIVGMELPTYWGLGREGLVHRLDRDTSGILVAAKTSEDQLDLIENWRSTKKVYLAVVHGIPAMASHVNMRRIAPDPVDERRSVVSDDGRYAETRWSLVETFADSHSLLECQILTGRKHQIRVHLLSDGYPIAGDDLYGPTKQPPYPPRLMLHASSLTVRHPRTGLPVTFESSLPNDFSSYLDLLRDFRS